MSGIETESEGIEEFDLNRVDNADIFKEELKYEFSEEELKFLCKKDCLEVVAFKTNALTVLEKKLRRDHIFKYNRELRLKLINYLKEEKNNKVLIKYYKDSYQRYQSTKNKRLEQRKINSLFSLGILKSIEKNYWLSNSDSETTIINTEEFLPGAKQNPNRTNNKENLKYGEDNNESSEMFLVGAPQKYANNININNNLENIDSETYSQFAPISVSTQSSRKKALVQVS